MRVVCASLAARLADAICTRSRRIGRRAEYSARAVSNADHAGTRIRAGDCRAPRRDRAWFYALAVSCVEFIMRGLGEIVRRSLLNLKLAASVEPRCRGCHKTKTPQRPQNQDVLAVAEARRRGKERLLGVRRSRSSRQATGRVNIKFGARLGSTKYRKFKEILPARGSQQKRRF